MNIRFLNILGLVSCLCFLVGNILYDLLDKTDPECVCYGSADYRIFFIPMSLMMFCMVLMAHDASKKNGGIIQILWWGFLWLSFGQIIKFLGFNPFVTMVSDYLFLSLVIIGTIIKLWKLKRKK